MLGWFRKLCSQFTSVFVCLVVLSTPAVDPTSSSHLKKGTPEGSFTEFCEQWVTFKDPQTGVCRPCSPCPEDHLTVVKCEFDRDTLCRPLTDLAEHIESVVHSTSSVLVSKKNSTVVIVEERTVFEQLLGNELSPVYVTLLSAVIFGCVFYIALLAFKKCRKQKQERRFKDPLQESLLGQDVQEEENEKPILDMDEMLAQRFGRSLVTNVYVP